MILIARIKQIVDGLLQYIQYDYESVPEHETFLLTSMSKQRNCS